MLTPNFEFCGFGEIETSPIAFSPATTVTFFNVDVYPLACTVTLYEPASSSTNSYEPSLPVTVDFPVGVSVTLLHLV